jgi:hypothetical protein
MSNAFARGLVFFAASTARDFDSLCNASEPGSSIDTLVSTDTFV